MKACTRCLIEKSFEAFSRRAMSRDGLQPACKPCVKLDRETKNYPSLTPERRKEDMRRYYEANRVEHYAKARAYSLARPEQTRAYKAAWKKRNPEKVAARQRERYANDLHFFLKKRVHRRTHAALKRQNVRQRYQDALGCTAAELKAHLERQFVEGMSWDNRAAWHVDHIRPIASFDLADEVQFRAACHYTNLQPLWAADNQKKGAK